MSECPGLTLSGESLRDGVDSPPTLADMGIAGAPLYTPRSGAWRESGEWASLLSSWRKMGVPVGGIM